MERNPSTHIYSSVNHIEIPQVDVLTLLFEHPACPANESTIIHASTGDYPIMYTKAEGREMVKRLAYVLRHTFGIGAKGPGKDVVVTISSGQCYLPILFYAVIAAGGIYSAASAAFTVNELARQINDGSSGLIFCSRDCESTAKEAAAKCDLDANRVCTLFSEPAWRIEDGAGNDVLATGVERLPSGEQVVRQMDWQRISDPYILYSLPILLLYSSGTTGAPKGVPLTNANMVAEATIPLTQLRDHNELLRRRDPSRPAFEYRTLAHLPAAHIAGVQGYFVNPFLNAGTVFWMERFDPAGFLANCERFRITSFFSAPPIYLMIAKSPAVGRKLRSVEFAVAGAAPMGSEVQRLAEEKMGADYAADADASSWPGGEAGGAVGSGCWLGQTWGLSETTGSVTIVPWGVKDLSGAVGEVLPGHELRIVDPDSLRDVAEGERGECWVRGPVCFTAYNNNPRASAESFHPSTDGGRPWFRTGDVGVVKPVSVTALSAAGREVQEERRWLYIVDRLKELIKYKGLQVAPAELEALLLEHPAIADVVVVGVRLPDERGEEGPRAYVVPVKEGAINAEEVERWVRDRAARHKWLRGGCRFVKEVPKSPAGKILRRLVRDMANKEDRAKL